MGIFTRINNALGFGFDHGKGTLDKTNPGDAALIKWNVNDYVKQESTLISSINDKIANDIADEEFEHLRYDATTGQFTNRLDENIYEVLNYTANGTRSNFDFWKSAIKQMLNSGTVYLIPNYTHRKRADGVIINTLNSLEISDGQPDDLDNAIVLVSPYQIDTTRKRALDNALTVITNKYAERDLKAIIKPNAIIDETGDRFEKRMKSTLDAFYQYADKYKIGVLDNKSSYEELHNNYQTVTPDELKVVEDEIYAAYGLNPNILKGTYTEGELKAYRMAVLEPIEHQLETELNRVLLTNNRRVVTSDKQTYERIEIKHDIFQYASLQELSMIFKQSTNMGLMTRNEGRKLLGLSPLLGGDVIATNKNSVSDSDNEDEGNDDDDEN